MYKLNFKELKGIDREPFNEDIMEMDASMPYSQASACSILSTELVYIYLDKFCKMYGISISFSNNRFKNIDLHKICNQTDEEIEEFIEIGGTEEDNYILLQKILELTDWETIVFDGGKIDNYMHNIGATDYLYTVEQMNSFLTNVIGAKSPIFPVCQKVSNIIEHSTGIDGGESWVLYNKHLGTYKKLIDKHNDIVKSELSEECKFINVLLGELEWILNGMWSRDSGYAGDYYCIAFCIGSDGCNYYSWYLLNYNVIISLFVLKEALNDFAMKLYQLLEEPEIEYIA